MTLHPSGKVTLNPAPSEIAHRPSGEPPSPASDVYAAAVLLVEREAEEEEKTGGGRRREGV